MAYVGKKFAVSTTGTEAAFEEKASSKFAQVTKLDIGAEGASQPVTGTALPNSKAGIDIGSLPVWASTGINSLTTGSTTTVLNVNTNGGVTPITAQPYNLIVIDEDGDNPRMLGTVLSVTETTITLTAPLPYTPTDYPSIYTLTPTFLTANEESGGLTSLCMAIKGSLPEGSAVIGKVNQGDGGEVTPWKTEVTNQPTVNAITQGQPSEFFAVHLESNSDPATLIGSVNTYLSGSEYLLHSIAYFNDGSTFHAAITEQVSD